MEKIFISENYLNESNFDINNILPNLTNKFLDSQKSSFLGLFKKKEQVVHRYDKQKFMIPGLKSFIVLEMYADKNVFYQEEDYKRIARPVDLFKKDFKMYLDDFTTEFIESFQNYTDEWWYNLYDTSKGALDIKNSKDYLKYFNQVNLQIIFPCDKRNKNFSYFMVYFICEHKKGFYVQSCPYTMSGRPLASMYIESYTKQ